MPRYSSIALAALLGWWATSVLAVNPAVWLLDETINRSDGSLNWVSPTAVDLGFDRYEYEYEITRITANVFLNSFDVTNLIDQSFDLNGLDDTASLPVVLIDSPLNDSTTGTTANVRIEVDQNGFGRGDFTNVMLGSINVGVPLNIESIRVEATISITGSNYEPGDYDQNGWIDQDDYGLWGFVYGSTAAPTVDGNNDGVVNAADYTIWRDAFNGNTSATATPEPGGLAIGWLGVAALVARRH